MDNLVCGNNVEVLSGMDKETIDLTVTSPPYDNLRNYNGYSFDVEALSQELFRVTKQGGIVVWVVGDAVNKGSETGTSFKQALTFMESGFRLHDTMIYEKNSTSFPARRDGNRYSQIFEYMFVFSKGKPKTAELICDKENKWAGHTSWGEQSVRNADGELLNRGKVRPIPSTSPRNNIWKYNVGKGFSTSDKEAHEHPAIFPEKLAEDHILTWSEVGDVVLDPFAGSGTTLKMAKVNNRNYVGIDISDEYVDLCKRRLDGIQTEMEI